MLEKKKGKLKGVKWIFFILKNKKKLIRRMFAKNIIHPLKGFLNACWIVDDNHKPVDY